MRHVQLRNIQSASVYINWKEEELSKADSTCWLCEEKEVKSWLLPAQHEETIEPSLPVGFPSALHLLTSSYEDAFFWLLSGTPVKHKQPLSDLNANHRLG